MTNHNCRSNELRYVPDTEATQGSEGGEVISNWKVKPLRSKKYRLFVASLPCCVCNSRYGVVPHHAGTGGMSTKIGDDYCVPLCFQHHEEMNNRRKDDIPGLKGILARLQAAYTLTKKTGK